MSSRSEIYTKTTDHDEAADSADGPPPMRDYKPAKMNPNSADQFWQRHQAEYEARGASARDPVERVRRHNAAYPQLRDELDRRRSLAKITPGKVIKMADGRIACTCDACLKIKQSLKKSREKSRRIGSRHDKKIVKCTEFCSRCNICRKVEYNLKHDVFDREDFPTDIRLSKNFKNRSPSNDKRSKSTRDLRTDKINNVFKVTPVKKSGLEKKKVASKPGTLKITRKFYNNTSIKNDSSTRERPRIDNADNGIDSDNATSSVSNKRYRSEDGSRAHSIATEPSVPSYNSTFSLGLENEPMVSRSQNT